MADGDREVEAGCLPAQLAFCEDMTSSPLIFIGGYRSGKTTALAQKMLALGVANAPTLGLIVAPTYTMVRDVVLRTILRLLQALDIPHRWHKQEHILTVGVGYPEEFDVLLRSGDNPDRLVGITAGWALIDEPGLQSEEVAAQVLTRVSDHRAKHPQLCLTGTPEGVSNWLYRWCVTDATPTTRVIRAKTTDNPKLPAGYVEGLRARYSAEEVEGYINGEFVVLEGGVYRDFRRAKHDRRCANPLEGKIVVGADFNVERMSWVVGRIVGDELHVWAEIIREEATQTFDQADRLIRLLEDEHDKHRLPFGERDRQSVTVFADASAAHRKTSATGSDVQILRSAGFSVMCGKSNPRVRDRVNTLNSRFRLDRCLVDVDRCPKLTMALETQPWRDGEPQKDGISDGPNDALGYLCWGQPSWRATIPRGNQEQHEHRFH